MSEYMGVSPTALHALGRVVVTAGRLEAVADEIANALGLNTTQDTLAPTLRHIRRAVPTALPAGAPCRPDDVTRWCDRASTVMRQRDSMLHASITLVPLKGGMWAMHEHLKTGAVSHVNHWLFEPLIETLLEVYSQGVEVHRRLTPGANAQDQFHPLPP